MTKMDTRFSDFDRNMMRRALQLAANGRGFTRSNPLVGAVIAAPDGRIIGEGWHRRFGQGHAEVNAVAAVAPADLPLLPQSTIYVTLEPCSHYGKTPPCAAMLLELGFKRVVVAVEDPFEKVSGRGIAMLRQGGVTVDVGLMADEARALNRRFITAHTRRRPFITVKWAQSLDGYLDHHRLPGEPAYRFSNPLTTMEVMRLRAEHEAILTTAATVLADNPRFTLRGYDGVEPHVFILDRSRRLAADSTEPSLANLHLGSAPERVTVISGDAASDLPEVMAEIYRRGYTSVLVEAGPTLIRRLLSLGLYDDLHCEVAPVRLASSGTSKL